MVEAGGVIAMAMRNHNEVQVSQVNVHGFDIGGKDFGVIAGIKQNLLARILDQNRKTPILLEVSRIPKSIIKDSCPAFGASRTEAAKAQQQAAKQAQANRRRMHFIETLLNSWFATKIDVQCGLHKRHSAADRSCRTLPQLRE